MTVDTCSTQSDSQLAQATIYEGTAFTELYQRYVERVYRYLLFRVGNVQDAQDLTTQTFVAALENIQQYRAEGSFAAWLLGIARFKAIDHQRKHHEQLPLESVYQVRHPDMLPDEVVVLKLEREDIVRTLRLLAPERAEALSLRFFAGLSNGEVAKAMQKSEAAVKMLVHRGLQDLRARLNPTCRADVIEG